MIEKLQEYEGSETSALSFRWHNMNISLVLTQPTGGERRLTTVVDDAEAVELGLGGNVQRWIISKADTVPSDAGVSTISGSSANDVTG